MEHTEEDINVVWKKGTAVLNVDPNVWRKDDCGAWISRAKYGTRESDYGWEIDHISPDGPDHLSNWRPLQWKNNVDKSDGKLKCNVTSNSNRNVEASR